MNILVTNDDGIESIGLKTLVKELSKIAKVYVAAPATQQSCTSISLNIHSPIQVEKREVQGAEWAYALYGSPADSTRMGLMCLYKDIHIDVVISGINQGMNSGCDILYSGTVGAAREAFIDGTPAMALSLNSFTNHDFSYAAKVGAELVQKFINDPKCHDYVLNVNVPSIPQEEIKGIKVCDLQGFRVYDDGFELQEKDGKCYIASTKNIIKDTDDPEDLRYDTIAIKKGYITVVALGINSFDQNYCTYIKGLFE